MALMSISDESSMSSISQGIRAHGERKRIVWATLADIAEGCMEKVLTMMTEKVEPLELIPDVID